MDAFAVADKSIMRAFLRRATTWLPHNIIQVVVFCGQLR